MSSLTAALATLFHARDFVESQIVMHPRIVWLAGLVFIVGALVV